MRQTSFLPDVAPPTTRELIDKLAKAKAMLKDQEAVDFGLFGERQLDICDLIAIIRLRMTALATETEADLFEEMLRRARTDLDGALIAACRAIASTKKPAKDIVAEYERAVKKQEQERRKQAYLQRMANCPSVELARNLNSWYAHWRTQCRQR